MASSVRPSIGATPLTVGGLSRTNTCVPTQRGWSAHGAWVKCPWCVGSCISEQSSWGVRRARTLRGPDSVSPASSARKVALPRPASLSCRPFFRAQDSEKRKRLRVAGGQPWAWRGRCGAHAGMQHTGTAAQRCTVLYFADWNSTLALPYPAARPHCRTQQRAHLLQAAGVRTMHAARCTLLLRLTVAGFQTGGRAGARPPHPPPPPPRRSPRPRARPLRRMQRCRPFWTASAVSDGSGASGARTPRALTKSVRRQDHPSSPSFCLKHPPCYTHTHTHRTPQTALPPQLRSR